MFVTQDPGDPSLYEFTVVNNSKSSIHSLMLGSTSDGDFEVTLHPRLIPEKGFAPPGWKFFGGVGGITGYETDKIKYLWQRKDKKSKESFIPPGATLGGFKLKMPGPTEELMNISFSVSLYSPHESFSGRVQPK